MKILIWLLIGGGIGAAMGYFGQCTSGTCPLTANWKRGALVGGAMGFLLYFGSGAAQRAGGGTSVSTANVTAIREEQFEAEVLKSEKPVVVDFYADWCGPCRSLAPLLDKVAGQFTNEVKVVKVNVDHAPSLARQYQVTGIPALKFFVGGELIGGLVGVPSASALEQQFRALTANKSGT